MYNKKGLSTIVTTLILVLLVLVAVGILWNPIKNLLGQNTEAFDTTQCLTLDLTVKANQATGSNSADYDLDVTREDSDGGEVQLKLIFNDVDTNYSAVITPTQSWTDFKERNTLTAGGPTYGVTDSVNAAPLINATQVEVIPYFVSEDSGKEVNCESKMVDILAWSP